jgi:hypothetical protein
MQLQLELCNMKNIILIIGLFLFSLSHVKAQTYFFGVSFGSAQFYHQINNKNYTDLSFSLPNIKLGKQINSKHAVVLYLPGTLYQYKESGRIRDRGFEAILPSYQYQINSKLSFLVGFGLGLDAPAFYDIKNESERKFYFGTAATSSIAYEFLKTKNFSLDLQTRVQYGKVKMETQFHEGFAFNVLLGINFKKDVQHK